MEKSYDAEAALNPGVMSGPPESAEAPQEGQEAQSAPVPQEREESEAPTKEGENLSEADRAYLSGLMKLLHSKETAPHVEEMLRSGPPEKTIPTVALQINGQMEQAIEKKPSLDTSIMAGVYLVQDLIEIGNTGGFFKIETPEQARPILQSTIQQYIEAGLKDGSIDPIELQEKVEPLMSEEERATGLQAAELTGIPKEANEEVAMSAYGKRMEQKGMMKGGKK